MTKNAECVLLADIGATNARFATGKEGVLGPITTLQVAQFPTLHAALHTFFRENTLDRNVHQALIAVAGPVKNGRAALTKCGLGHRYRGAPKRVRLENDARK